MSRFGAPWLLPYCMYVGGCSTCETRDLETYNTTSNTIHRVGRFGLYILTSRHFIRQYTNLRTYYVIAVPNPPPLSI